MDKKIFVVNDLNGDEDKIAKVVNFIESSDFSDGDILVENGGALVRDLWNSDFEGPIGQRKEEQKEKFFDNLERLNEAVRGKGGSMILVNDFYLEKRLGGESRQIIGDPGFCREINGFLKKNGIQECSWSRRIGRVLIIGAQGIDYGLGKSVMEELKDIEIVVAPYVPVFDGDWFPFKVYMNEIEKKRIEKLKKIIERLPGRRKICIGGHLRPDRETSGLREIAYDSLLSKEEDKAATCVWNPPGKVIKIECL